MSYESAFLDFETMRTETMATMSQVQPETVSGLRLLGPSVKAPCVPCVPCVPAYQWTEIEVTPDMQQLANAIHDGSAARRRMGGV